MKQASKKKTSKNFSSIVCSIFALVFILAITYNLVLKINVYSELSKQESELTATLLEEQDTFAQLKQQKELNKTDEYIEKVAREQLGFVKSDEVVFVRRPEGN